MRYGLGFWLDQTGRRGDAHRLRRRRLVPDGHDPVRQFTHTVVSNTHRRRVAGHPAASTTYSPRNRRQGQLGPSSGDDADEPGVGVHHRGGVGCAADGEPVVLLLDVAVAGRRPSGTHPDARARRGGSRRWCHRRVARPRLFRSRGRRPAMWRRGWTPAARGTRPTSGPLRPGSCPGETGTRRPGRRRRPGTGGCRRGSPAARTCRARGARRPRSSPRSASATDDEQTICPPCATPQILETSWTVRPTYSPPEMVTGPLWIPMRTRSRTPSGQLWLLDPLLGGDRTEHRVVRGREDEEHAVALAAHRPAPVFLEGSFEHAVVDPQAGGRSCPAARAGGPWIPRCR